MSLIVKTYSLVIPLLGMLLVTAGCQSAPYSSKGTKSHTVNVGPKIEPLQINAGRGDEVRWVNQRSEPIAVVFPKSDAVSISCRSGFKTVDQTILSAVVLGLFSSVFWISFSYGLFKRARKVDSALSEEQVVMVPTPRANKKKKGM